jgi:hypothetical protein
MLRVSDTAWVPTASKQASAKQPWGGIRIGDDDASSTVAQARGLSLEPSWKQQDTSIVNYYQLKERPEFMRSLVPCCC